MLNEFLAGLPIVTIGTFAIFALLVDAFSGKDRKPMFIFTIASLIITAIVSAYTLTFPLESIKDLNSQELISTGMMSFGGYAAYFDILFCLAGIMTLFSARPYFIKSDYEYKEFYTLILYAISGMMLIAHSKHLLVLFIGVELMSIPFYIMSGYFRNRTKSVESSLKYFLLGAFATGFLVYGMAMIYGATGSMYLDTIASHVVNGGIIKLYFVAGIALLIIGLSFKVAAFPFHQWAPDVYEGAPTVVTAFMSTAGKAAALIGFIIVGRSLLPSDAAENVMNTIESSKLIIALISAATMLVGNISALVQKNVKRMLAYSSVAHAGYLLMGIVAGNDRGWTGILFYITAYMFMQIGSFVIVSIIENKEEKNLDLDDYAGLSKSHPVLAALMGLFMLSLAGIPPMAGFFGKYYLFTAAIESGFTWLTIVAVISSIISVYFYIGLIVYMYFKDKEGEALQAKAGLAGITLAISGFGILFFGIFPDLLVQLSKYLF